MWSSPSKVGCSAAERAAALASNECAFRSRRQGCGARSICLCPHLHSLCIWPQATVTSASTWWGLHPLTDVEAAAHVRAGALPAYLPFPYQRRCARPSATAAASAAAACETIFLQVSNTSLYKAVSAGLGSAQRLACAGRCQPFWQGGSTKCRIPAHMQPALTPYAAALLSHFQLQRSQTANQAPALSHSSGGTCLLGGMKTASAGRG